MSWKKEIECSVAGEDICSFQSCKIATLVNPLWLLNIWFYVGNVIDAFTGYSLLMHISIEVNNVDIVAMIDTNVTYTL